MKKVTLAQLKLIEDLKAIEYQIHLELNKFEGVNGIVEGSWGISVCEPDMINGWVTSLDVNGKGGSIYSLTSDEKIKEDINKLYEILKTTKLAKYLKLRSSKTRVDARIDFKIPKVA